MEEYFKLTIYIKPFFRDYPIALDVITDLDKFLCNMRVIQATSSSDIAAGAVERSDSLEVRGASGGEAGDIVLSEWMRWEGRGSPSLGCSLAGSAEHCGADGLDPLVWLGITVSDSCIEVLPAINATKGWVLGLQTGDGRLDGGGIDISAAIIGTVEDAHYNTCRVPASGDDTVVGAGVCRRAESRVELSIVPRDELGTIGGNSLRIEVEVREAREITTIGGGERGGDRGHSDEEVRPHIIIEGVD